MPVSVDWGRVKRWAMVILVGVILYVGAKYLAHAAGWTESQGGTIVLGIVVGLGVGALAAALGLIGGRDEG